MKSARSTLGIAASAVLIATTVALALPEAAGAQDESSGPGFCDLVGEAFGDTGQTECENQGGDALDQVVKPATDATCSSFDSVLTEFEEGGGEAIAEPVRETLEDLGCVFPEGDTTPTTAPPGGGDDDTTPTTIAQVAGEQSGPLPVTGGGLLVGGAGLGLVGLAALARRLFTRL